MTTSQPSGPWEQSRQPIDAVRLRQLLDDGRWDGELIVTDRTESTNADLADLARGGAPNGSVATTDHQYSGRGRLERTFVMPPCSGLAVSALIRPTAPMSRWSWLPLVAGLAVADTASDAGVRGAAIKWPNDVLVEQRKICGILLEAIQVPEQAAIIGIGVNVSLTAEELPVPTATSLWLQGAQVLDRTQLAAILLDNLDRRLAEWEEPGDQAIRRLRDEFVEHCDTIGRQVRIELPDGSRAEGLAETVDTAGRLVVAGRAYGAGDVTHVRPAG